MKWFSFFVLTLFINVSVYAGEVKLQNGTVIPVKAQDVITEKSVTSGQTVSFVVATDVVVDGKVVIKAGAPVLGIVQEAKEAQMAGIAGKMIVSLQSVSAVDGTNVQLSGQFISEGKSEMGGTIAVAVILCPLALLNKGGEAMIPAGAQTRGIVVSDYYIKVD